VGKSECLVAHGGCGRATGRFCRQCLLVRYGEDLETVVANVHWRCPHCAEADGSRGAGWMCNSSICMQREGLAPTGVAIHAAQEAGFPSVAHWLQARVMRSGRKCLTDDAAVEVAAMVPAPVSPRATRATRSVRA